MDLTYSSKKLQKLCDSAKNLRAEFGDQMAKVVQRRLADLAAAPTLEEMRLLPGHCHELRSDLKGKLALDLVQPNRLVFEPNHDPPPVTSGGALDWKCVTRITIVGIGDYHG